jgi:Zn-dependent protease with chaperone function
MPILVILLLLAAVLPVDWPDPAIELTARQSALATGALVLASLLGSATVSGLVARGVRRRPERRATVGRLYLRWRRAAFFLNVGINLVAVFALGWGQVVQDHLLVRWTGWPVLAPLAELLVPGPYLFTLAVNWAVYWPAERALHRAGGATRPFWSLTGYWLFQARQFLVPVFLVVLLFAAHQSVGRFFPQLTTTWWYQAAMPLGAVGLAVLLPRVVKPLLGWKPLPPGPARDRLEATARRLGVRYTDLLVWPTRGAMANAVVIGLVPWSRYVVFTDRLLDGLEPDELDAVFGHEAGHIRFGHLPYYMLFLTLSSATVAAVILLAADRLKAADWVPDMPTPWADLLALPPLGLMGAYLFLVFGWLSRVCERQADLFGGRAGSCPDRGCAGHAPDTPLVTRGRGLCPTGARAMARALERVYELNGWDPTQAADQRAWVRLTAWFRAWQHGPIPARVNYLLRVADRPELASAHDRKAFRVRLVLVLILGGVATLGVAFGGWDLWALM